MTTPRWWSIIIVAMIPACLAAADSPVLSADELHKDAPPFTVEKRNNRSKFAECSKCHEEEDDIDPEPRRLRTRHVKKIDHGGNRFWCFTCHAGDNIDYLRTSSNERIEFDDLPEHVREPDPASQARASTADTLADARAAFEREFLLEKLQASGWNISRTAELVGLKRESLSRKIRSLGIDAERERNGGG